MNPSPELGDRPHFPSLTSFGRRTALAVLHTQCKRAADAKPLTFVRFAHVRRPAFPDTRAARGTITLVMPRTHELMPRRHSVSKIATVTTNSGVLFLFTNGHRHCSRPLQLPLHEANAATHVNTQTDMAEIAREASAIPSRVA